MQVQCYGIRILMNVLVEDRPTTCNLLYGNVRVGHFKRTVMRADTARMPLPSLSDYSAYCASIAQLCRSNVELDADLWSTVHHLCCIAVSLAVSV
jgi:hypothetical protein